MLGQIRKLQKQIQFALLLLGATAFTSCATKKETAFVKDPDAKQESMIPWNRQEKWETGGQFSGITDRR